MGSDFLQKAAEAVTKHSKTQSLDSSIFPQIMITWIIKELKIERKLGKRKNHVLLSESRHSLID